MLKIEGTANAVTTDTTQTVSGAKTFSSPIVMSSLTSINWGSSTVAINQGTSTNTGVGIISGDGNTQPILTQAYKGITPGANGTTVETTLQTYLLSQFASLLNTAGRGIRISAWGTFAANGNTKTLKLKFGATDLTGGTFTGAFNGGGWLLEAKVLRVTATTQTAVAEWATTSATPINVKGYVTAPGETLSGSSLIVVTGQSGTASSDVICTAIYIEYLP